MSYIHPMYELRDFLASDGRNVIRGWLDNLQDAKARARIQLRLMRLSHGNFGDCKPLRDGVWELRIDHGPGYRVYYSQVGKVVILLLCGGDKRKQASDIEKAAAYLAEFRERAK